MTLVSIWIFCGLVDFLLTIWYGCYYKGDNVTVIGLMEWFIFSLIVGPFGLIFTIIFILEAIYGHLLKKVAIQGRKSSEKD